ncbi:MAG: hypothetical protein WD042_00635 [Phycisphaeraceae bacterium]
MLACTAAAQPRLGINLNGPSDWNSELPFVDVFRQSRTWISQREGQDWGKGPPLELDEHGWVHRLESGCYAESPLCTIRGGHYPSGEYVVLYEGKGTIQMNKARIVQQKPGRLVIDVPKGGGGFFLQVRQTDPNDYIRNIRVIMPGFEATYQKEPFHPAFLGRWRHAAVIRFMDWMHTNNSKISTWKQRPEVEDATWSNDGVPLEVMIELCNQLNVDPWFCIPHMADDDYVRHFAELVRDRLNPKLKAYVEYSNEVWNRQFAQQKYAAQQGQALKLSDNPQRNGWAYTSVRSVEIFGIFEDVFKGTDRLIRVLPSQAANSFVAEQITSFRDAYRHADALAIAPYFGFAIPSRDAARWRDAGAEAVLDHIEKETLPDAIGNIQENKRVADKHKLKLIAYEAGQHLVGVGGAEKDQKLMSVLQAANRHERMGKLYLAYFDAWAKEGGDVMAVFNSIAGWTKWGSWGLMQYYDDNPADNPKMQAVKQWLDRQKQK